MRTGQLLGIVVLLTAASLTGCGTAAKEAVGIFTGAKGVYAPITAVSADKEARPLGQYKRFELGAISDDFGGNVPSDLLPHLRQAFPEVVAEAELPDEPGGKTLVIRGKILHYEDAGTLAMVTGPLEEVIARLEMVDKDSGQVLGVANCIGRTTTRTTVGIANKGRGLAKAIVSWIDKRYPQEGRVE